MQRQELENKAIELARKIYRLPDGIVGGPLHIVLDDGNLEDAHISWCVNFINNEDCDSSDELKKLCLECAEILLQLPMKSRCKIYHAFYEG